MVAIRMQGAMNTPLSITKLGWSIKIGQCKMKNEEEYVLDM